MANADSMRRGLDRRLDTIAAQVGAHVERDLHREAESWPHATGYTSERIDHHVLRSARHRRVVFTSKSKHGLWRERGTKPHRIVARRAPSLVFFWPKVGRVVSFRSVNHPGQKPRPWFFRTIKASLRSMRVR